MPPDDLADAPASYDATDSRVALHSGRVIDVRTDVVHFPGGDLRVRLAAGRAWLTGPAEPLGELPDSGLEAGTER